MVIYNFWIMDVSVSAFVFLSAIYGDKMRWKDNGVTFRRARKQIVK